MTGYRWAWNSPRLPSRTRPLAATFAPKMSDAAESAPPHVAPPLMPERKAAPRPEPTAYDLGLLQLI